MWCHRKMLLHRGREFDYYSQHCEKCFQRMGTADGTDADVGTWDLCFLPEFIIIICYTSLFFKSSSFNVELYERGEGMRILINNKVVRYLTEGPHFIALCKWLKERVCSCWWISNVMLTIQYSGGGEPDRFSFTWNWMAVPCINNLSTSNMTYSWSNPGHTQLSGLIIHVNIFLIHQCIQNLFHWVIDSCIHFNPNSFCCVVL